jgi:hypothetical protein
MATGVKITGLPEVVATLERTGDKMHRSIRDIVAQGAENIRKTAFDMAPIRTGDLENSIQIRKDDAGGGRVMHTVYINEASWDHRHQSDYYIRVHEGIAGKGFGPANYGDTPLGHAKSEATGEVVGPKYLYRALNRWKPSIAKRVRQELARIAARGGR